MTETKRTGHPPKETVTMKGRQTDPARGPPSAFLSLCRGVHYQILI